MDLFSPAQFHHTAQAAVRPLLYFVRQVHRFPALASQAMVHVHQRARPHVHAGQGNRQGIEPFVRAEIKLSHTWKKRKGLEELWNQCHDIDDVEDEKDIIT